MWLLLCLNREEPYETGWIFYTSSHDTMGNWITSVQSEFARHILSHFYFGMLVEYIEPNNVGHRFPPSDLRYKKSLEIFRRKCYHLSAFSPKLKIKEALFSYVPQKYFSWNYFLLSPKYGIIISTRGKYEKYENWMKSCG